MERKSVVKSVRHTHVELKIKYELAQYPSPVPLCHVSLLFWAKDILSSGIVIHMQSAFVVLLLAV